MTQIKASQTYARISPNKARLVAAAIKHLSVTQALKDLNLIRQSAAPPIARVLTQALANATNNLKLSPSRLILKRIDINQGPAYKRWQPVSRGRAHEIRKPTTHIRVILESQEERGPKS